MRARVFGTLFAAALLASPVWVKAGPTFTPTFTPSQSPTAIPSITWTFTSTNTPTVLTATPTVTDTPTITPTGTINTPTITNTPTFTCTRTPTATVTYTATVTSTVGIGSFRVEPKTLSGPVTLRWNLTAAVDHLNITAFTSSFRMLKRFPLDQKKQPDFFKSGDHELPWDGLDDRGRHLVPGRYYLFLTISKGKQKFSSEEEIEQP